MQMMIAGNPNALTDSADTNRFAVRTALTLQWVTCDNYTTCQSCLSNAAATDARFGGCQVRVSFVSTVMSDVAPGSGV
jgi:hypothetical protein